MLAQKLMLETREAEFLAIARFSAIEEAGRARGRAAPARAGEPPRSDALAEANPG
jgi:hypothetical protein